MNISRLQLILFTIIFNILAVIVFANVSWSNWQTGMALNIFDNAVLIWFAWKNKDQFLKNLILFGLVLGFTELFADAWLVDFTKTLDYSIGGGPMIWRSPLWMPFAWEVVAVQFAVLGLWFVEKFKGQGLVLAGLIGAINIPFYEEMALKTKWWAYSNCRMFLHTPYYIILGEFLIVIAIVLLSRKLAVRSMKGTVWQGVKGGVAIFFCYVLAFWIFERAF